MKYPASTPPAALNRRRFLTSAAALTAGASLSTSAQEKEKLVSDAVLKAKTSPVVLFTKHLGWLDYRDLAAAMVEIGYDGADLTVRPGGHVLPENAVRDLPRAVEAIRDAGLEVNMITTQIADPDDPVTEAILKTASGLGIRLYRIGTWRYRANNRNMFQELKEWNARLKALADMNAQYNMTAVYHNHSGQRYIGGAIWDIHEMMDGISRDLIGVNYDIGHAVLEGSGGAWETNFQLIADRIHSSAIKDCGWYRESGKWESRFVPMGEGFVPWTKAIRMMNSIDFTGPFSMHFEYDIPEGNNDHEKLQNHIHVMKRDLKAFRNACMAARTE